MKGSQNMSLLLISEQGIYGTMVTPLISTDIVETIGVVKITNNPNNTELSLVAGGLSQDASIPGAIDQDISFQIPMRVAAADNVGQCGKVMRLCGMKETEGTDGIFSYTFTSKQSEMKDGTVWGYSGNLDSSESVRKVGFNAVFSPKWTIEAGKFSVMDVTSKMCFAPWAAATQPTITKEQTLPSAFVGATTVTIMGDTDYKLLSLTIDPQQEIRLTKDPKATYGYGASIITDRKIKFTAKVYRDNLSTVDPMTLLLGKTIAAIEVTYGTAPQKVTYASSYAQINTVEEDDEEGVESYTINGLFERNDFTVTLSTK